MTTQFAPTTWDGTLEVSTYFGAVDDLHSTPHSGVDIVTSGPCYAPFAGTVQRSIAAGDSGGGLGNYFQMISDDGQFVFIVGHGNDNSDTGLRSGDHVVMRQAIMADMGRPTTGYSTGPHYHEQLQDNGTNVDLLSYLGQSYNGSNGTPITGWQVGQTDFTGTYGENKLNGALWYCIEPASDNSKTISGVCANYGVDLGTARAWTAAVAASKWGAQLLQSGSSWWDGSDTYYAGVCVALNDITTILDTYEADQLAAQLAALTAANNAVGAAVKVAGHTDSHTPAVIVRPMPPMPDPLPQGNPDTNPDAPLAGLLAGSPQARKRAYYSYAAAALLVSFGPDIITAGILTSAQAPVFVAILGLVTSVILKVGVAFGFVAASNTKN